MSQKQCRHCVVRSEHSSNMCSIVAKNVFEHPVRSTFSRVEVGLHVQIEFDVLWHIHSLIVSVPSDADARVGPVVINVRDQLAVVEDVYTASVLCACSQERTEVIQLETVPHLVCICICFPH